jgi:pimeloyl-ACP methyl ester carboxylesterase
MPWPGEQEGFQKAVATDSPWRNEIGPGLFFTLPLFRPVSKAPRLSMPVWVGLAEQDLTVSRKAVEKLANRAPDTRLVRYPGEHFDPLVDDTARQVISDQVAFLQSTVLR